MSNQRGTKRNLIKEEKKEKIEVPSKKSKKLTVQEVKQLIKSGNYEQKDDYWYFLVQKNKEVFKALLEYDPSEVNLVDDEGDSLLMKDIYDCNCRNFQLLIDKGANVNHCNYKGFTALHYAFMNSLTPIEIIHILIKLGADVNKKLKFSCDDLKLFDSDDDSDESDTEEDNESDEDDETDDILPTDGDTPLILSLKDYCGVEKVMLLINAGADVNLANKSGRTPLMTAAAGVMTYDIPIIKYLLNKGAKAGLYDSKNNTAINLLVGSIENFLVEPEEETKMDIKEYLIPTIDLLIAAGEDIFMPNNKNESPLQTAFAIYEDNFFIRNLVIHLIKVVFKKLEQDVPIESVRVHPMDIVRNNMDTIKKDTEFNFKEIAHLIDMAN